MPTIIVDDAELEFIKAAVSYARTYLFDVTSEADLVFTEAQAEIAETKLYVNCEHGE